MSTLSLIIFFLSVVDVVAYGYAPYPQRTKWYFKIPGGGIVAYLILK